MTQYIGGKQFSDAGQLQVISASSSLPAGAVYLGGWACKATGEVYVIDQGASAVPAGAVFVGGVACHQDGRVYVTTQAVASTDKFLGGFAVRQDGALRVNTSAVTAGDSLIGGWAVKSDGAARVSTLGDPYFSSVVLLAGNEQGADGATTFLDQSSGARTLTRGGNAVWATANAPTGLTSSVRIPGGASDNVSAADAAAWILTGDYTLEILVRADATTGQYKGGISQWGGTSNFALGLAAETAGRASFMWAPNSIANALLKDTSDYLAATWYWLATDRVGSAVRLYLAQLGGAGSVIASGTQAGAGNNGTGVLSLGNFVGGGNPAALNWACARITNGVGRYGGSYTPPAIPLPTS